MSEIKTSNARIDGTHLGFEDHGIFTAWLHLEHDNGHQGFGGYVLSGQYLDRFINRVLKIAEVGKWEDLEGKYIRVKRERSKIHEIGNLLKDVWFNPSEEFKEMESNEK